MRMRKKPWAKDMIKKRTDCVISSPEILKGKWHSLGFGTIVVEVGAGKGDYWIGMGEKNPDELWIAVEKNIDAAAMALKKSLACTKENMKFIVDDANQIDLWFEDGEVDRIHLNFSDPWPKKAHTKRRLTYGTFLKRYEKILKKDGCIIMKTDNARLFEYSLVTFSENEWLLKDVSVDFRREVHDEDVITEYENNFMQLGQPIYRAIFQVSGEKKDE
ncbi:MAG: tRNA (guanosine(46)-N7)-methyltransferase TrmB [Bacillota bacterium]|jgi:tRNA (guanine-N7-)-methyltransferase|nr:tRNA (guanosine(46)-N7)-methyltransferase TrmB [Bacillota bacterium]NLL26602.1 tRNA (guanosine(46)-N7)-methyltransferase TrmB [Erysipelotrichia bacterium]